MVLNQKKLLPDDIVESTGAETQLFRQQANDWLRYRGPLAVPIKSIHM